MAEAENSPPGLRGGKGVHWNLKICVLKIFFVLSVGKIYCWLGGNWLYCFLGRKVGEGGCLWGGGGGGGPSLGGAHPPPLRGGHHTTA